MANRRALIIAALLLAAAHTAGCYSPYMRWPDLYHPGSAAQQRAEADKFDPYPSPDAGPEIVGGRPPGYLRPYTEEEWARRYTSPGGVLQAAPIPALPSAPIITTPYPPATSAVPAAVPPPASPFGVQPRSPY